MAKKDGKNIKDKTSFIKSFKAELKKVIWPTPKQLFNNTVAVLAIVLITAVIVFVLDFAFESINKYGVNRIKEVVTNSSVANEANEDTNSETNANEVNDQTNSDANVNEENVAENNSEESNIAE